MKVTNTPEFNAALEVQQSDFPFLSSDLWIAAADPPNARIARCNQISWQGWTSRRKKLRSES